MFQCVRTEFEDDGLAGAFCVDQPRCKEGINNLIPALLSSLSLCALPDSTKCGLLCLELLKMFDDNPAGRLVLKVGAGCFIQAGRTVCDRRALFFFSFLFFFFSLGRNILIYLCADKNVSSDSLFT